MGNALVIGILAIVIGLGIYSTVKHFKGQGGCCGGGDYRPRRKRLSKILYRKKFKVDGMHCAHCKRRVEETVNDVPGVAGKVDLRNGTLLVSYAEPIDDAVIKERIERVGYIVTKICEMPARKG